MEDITNLIDKVKDGNNVEAGKAFNTLMADKVSAALDAKKIDIASNLKAKEVETQEEE